MCNYLSPPQLLAYMDGLAPTWVARHILHCPDCRARLARWEKAHTRLTHAFGQAQAASPRREQLRHTTGPCLPAMTLGEYYLNTLDYQTAHAVWRHLQSCPACRQRLDETIRFLDDRRPATFIAYPWTPTPGRGWETTAPSSAAWQVRAGALDDGHRAGFDDPSQTRLGDSGQAAFDQPGAAADLTFKVQEAEINLSIRPTGATPAGYTIIGLVTGLATNLATPVALTIASQAAPVAVTHLDLMGGFQLDHIPPGEYTMTLHTPQVDYILRAIQL